MIRVSKSMKYNVAENLAICRKIHLGMSYVNQKIQIDQVTDLQLIIRTAFLVIYVGNI